MRKDEMIKFFSASSGGVCSMLIAYEDGTVTKHPALPCHALLTRLKNPDKITEMWTSLRLGRSASDKKFAQRARKYWDYILSPRLSPWRSILRGSEILKDDKGKYLAVKIIIDDKTQPQVLANLFIATRHVNEYPAIVNAFGFLREKRIRAASALYLSAHYSLDLKEKNFVKYYSSGHHAFNSAASISYAKLKNAQPFADPELSIRNGDTYYQGGATNIWNGRKQQVPIPPEAAPKKYGGMFAGLFSYYRGGVSKEALMFPAANTFDALKALKYFKKTEREWTK